MYIPREIEYTIDTMLAQGKVVLVTGARQVGKTTTLQHHLGDAYNYVSLDNPAVYALAKQDAVLFFEQHTLPLIIDEVQRAPELFSSIKWKVDQLDATGRVVLSGSQTYHLMKGVSESLAGRIRIIEMPPLSFRELFMRRTRPHPYIPHLLGKDEVLPAPENFDIWSLILKGSMPELQDTTIDLNAFYTDYVAAYLERDVRELINVKDEAKFYSFLVACAARTGQLFNASDIASGLGINYKTVKAWLSVLQASNIVCVVEPFWSNIGKSLTKTPKIYFMDTGLVCYLTRWITADQLRLGAVSGQLFETFVVSEVLKSYMNAGANLRDVWFYRDQKKREIDLVIQEGHILHPVEIKTNALVDRTAIKTFTHLENIAGYELGFGHVICQTPEPYLINRNVQAVGVWAI